MSIPLLETLERRLTSRSLSLFPSWHDFCLFLATNLRIRCEARVAKPLSCKMEAALISRTLGSVGMLTFWNTDDGGSQTRSMEGILALHQS